MTTTVTATRTVPRRKPGPVRLVQSHPLISFFLLANLMSWAAWTPYVVSQNGLGLWAFRFPELFGSSQFTGVLPGAYLGPIAAAFAVTAIADGRAGLRRWVARLWHWRVSPKWYAGALLGVPAVLLLTGFVFSAGEAHAPTLSVLALYVPYLILQMLTTGLAEEPGWRDFALPRLQSRFGPLRASLILGPLWAVWHLPLYLSDWGGPNVDWTRPLLFIAFCICFNFVMSWVFNRTGQSLPLAMLTHISLNNFASVVWSSVFPSLDFDQALLAQTVAAAMAAAVLLVRTRGRLGYTGTRG